MLRNCIVKNKANSAQLHPLRTEHRGEDCSYQLCIHIDVTGFFRSVVTSAVPLWSKQEVIPEVVPAGVATSDGVIRCKIYYDMA